MPSLSDIFQPDVRSDHHFEALDPGRPLVLAEGDRIVITRNAKVLGMMGFWTGLQSDHDTALERERIASELKKIKPWRAAA
jgi:hypothetical protein